MSRRNSHEWQYDPISNDDRGMAYFCKVCHTGPVYRHWRDRKISLYDCAGAQGKPRNCREDLVAEVMEL